MTLFPLVVPHHVTEISYHSFLFLMPGKEISRHSRLLPEPIIMRTLNITFTLHFCFILSTGTRIRIDSVMRPRSSSRGRNTSSSVTVSYLIIVLCVHATYLLTDLVPCRLT